MSKKQLSLTPVVVKTYRYTTIQKNENYFTRSTMQASGTLGRTTTVPTPLLGLSRSCFKRCFLWCFTLPYSQTLKHGRGFRGVLDCSCLALFVGTLDLALTHLALDSVLAISVVFLEILMGDAVATVPLVVNMS